MNAWDYLRNALTQCVKSYTISYCVLYIWIKGLHFTLNLIFPPFFKFVYLFVSAVNPFLKHAKSKVKQTEIELW